MTDWTPERRDRLRLAADVLTATGGSVFGAMHGWGVNARAAASEVKSDTVARRNGVMTDWTPERRDRLRLAADIFAVGRQGLNGKGGWAVNLMADGVGQKHKADARNQGVKGEGADGDTV